MSSSISRLAVTVRGVVQGVGFRPFVYNTATSLMLSGWVLNEADTVRIEVQGDRASLDRFLDALRHAAPPQARVHEIKTTEIAVVESGNDGATGVFEIRTSDNQPTSLPRPTLPADLATCRECWAEINDETQRRYRYPFTNCTNCGPRWSIVRQTPYDRPRTSMAKFAMCAECQAEYDNPADRRFHAQPIACPRCGPTLRLLDTRGHELSTGDAALVAAVDAILTGRIVALKGLGGFQLLADATNAEVVARLRERKHRPDRPLAIMSPSLDDVRLWCEVSRDEAEMLTSHESPIVLLKKRDNLTNQKNSPPPAVGVAPGNPYLGIMLPYTPLHHLLMQGVGRPIVCTSGNLSEEPMAISTDEAIRRLGPIADVLLTHNRPIVRPVDDSIVRFDAAGLQVLRRARGFAPLPLEIGPSFLTAAPKTPHARPDGAVLTVLAVGGHLKNTVALCLGNNRNAASSGQSDGSPAQVVMSAHIGDLDSVRSVEVFRRAIDDLVDFFQVKPDAVVCDLHPDYASTRHAEQLAAKWNVPLVRVQHHHAHVAACMAEHGLTGPVLGFSWDGTGYGPDGTVWGGEVLLCDGAGFHRVAHLRTFSLPGGDRASRQPRRSAFGLLHEILGQQAAELATQWFTATEIESLQTMLARRLRSPRTSSMGRLFDAVAAICRPIVNDRECLLANERPAGAGQHHTSGSSNWLAALPPVISFEGQAAMALEYAADESELAAYSFVLTVSTTQMDKPPLVIDWEPVIRDVLADRAAGISVGRISARFHNALAAMAVDVARHIGCPQIVLTGGCFQNTLLTRRAHERLSAAGFHVYTHRRVPPGDGGIALGQVLVALRQL